MRKLIVFAFVALSACGGGGGGGGGGGTVATPVLSPAAGTFATKPSVAITCATSGATIYYTSDGTAPTASSPVYSAAIAITTTTTVKAYATASGMTDSAVASATYTLQAGAPALSPTPATYATAQNVTLTSATPGAAIHYTTDGTAPTASSPTYATPIALALGASATTTTVKAFATATGFQDSTVTSGTYVIDATATPAVQPTFSPGAGTYTAAQSVTIATTTSGASLYYTTDGSTPTTASTLYAGPVAVASSLTLKAIASGGGHSASTVASAAYVINLPATATPTFSPAAGAVASGTSVAISTTTAGAAIYYTTNGSTPTAASTHYTAAIPVTSAVTLKAMATAAGHADSAVATAAYTIAGGGGTQFKDYCVAYTDAAIAKFASCQHANPDFAKGFLGGQSEFCNAWGNEISPLNYVTYNSSHAQGCVTAVQGLTCAQWFDSSAAPPSECTAALVGTRGQGQSCNSNIDCSAGYCGFELTAGTCPDTCRPLLALNAACTDSVQCGPGHECFGGFCKALAAETGSCPCQSDLWCDDSGGAPGTCKKKLVDGTACTSGEQCAFGSSCAGVPAKCTIVPVLGQPCTTAPSDNCGLGYTCNTTSHTCDAYPALGQACTSFCVNAYCDILATSPTCKAFVADGATCTPGVPFQCASGYCSTATQKCAPDPKQVCIP